jgi:hypothetical protein
MSVYVGILFIQIYPLDIYRERERVYQYNLTYFLWIACYTLKRHVPSSHMQGIFITYAYPFSD